MCVLPALAAKSGGLGSAARTGLFGLAGAAIGRKRPKPDRQSTLYPNDGGGL